MLQERSVMSGAKVNLLIVDDEPRSVRALSVILAESGYRVRSAADGFSALVEIRSGIPDILLSDLNMPGMSGFELLSVVRRRFPAIQVIAMSGDVFRRSAYRLGLPPTPSMKKATNLESLLQIVEAMTRSERQSSLQHSSTMAPIWIPRNGHDPSGDAYVVITCPECLRTFSQDSRQSHLVLSAKQVASIATA